MRRVLLLLALLLIIGACGDDEPTTVRVLAHDFFVVPDDLAARFQADTGYDLEIVLGGDAGIVVNQAILTAGSPVADVIFGVDTTLLSRALDNDLFLPYRSPLLDEVPRHLHVTADMATPIDIGDVCLNYDTARLAEPPASLADLTDAAFSKLLVVPDPTISSPGLAFMLSTIAEFGETGPYTWRDYWADLRANDVLVVPDWGTAYYGAFSGTAGGGDRPLVVSYASSPAAEVLFADPPVAEATTAAIEAGCFRQVEYAGILRGAGNTDGARALIDFMLSEGFQAAVPTSMFVYPVRSDVQLPDVFVDNAIVPAHPNELDPALIEENRERWLSEWVETVLR